MAKQNLKSGTVGILLKNAFNKIREKCPVYQIYDSSTRSLLNFASRVEVYIRKKTVNTQLTSCMVFTSLSVSGTSGLVLLTTHSEGGERDRATPRFLFATLIDHYLLSGFFQPLRVTSINFHLHRKNKRVMQRMFFTDIFSASRDNF